MTTTRMTTLLMGVLVTVSVAKGVRGTIDRGTLQENIAPALRSSPAEASDEEVSRAIAILTESTSDQGALRDAADIIVSADTEIATGFFVAGLLSNEPFAQVLVTRVREIPTPPEHLVDELFVLLDEGEPPTRRLAFASLTRWNGRASIDRLIARLSAEPLLTGDEMRAYGVQLRELLALSPGQGPDGDDERAWRTWWKEQQTLSDTEWATRLADRHRTLARESAREAEELARTLRDVYRRMYALLPEDSRSGFIADLLSSQRRGVRELGFDLATQALLNARTLGPEVRDAALTGARESDVALRRRAAALIERLSLGEGSAPLITDWLASEEDGQTVSPLLRLVSREPELLTEGMVGPVTKWLKNGDDTLEAAFEAMLALHHKGLLNDEVRERLALRAEGALAESPTTLRVRIVDAVGDDSVLIPVLKAGGDLTLASARALRDRPEALDAIIEAARTDDRLFEIVTEAMARHRPVPGALSTLLTLPAPSIETKRIGASTLVSAMAPEQQLEAMTGISSPADITAYLAHAGNAAFYEQAESHDACIRLTLALARARLAMRDPEGAISALSAIPGSLRTAETEGVRTHALVWLGRLEEARALHEAFPELPAEVWLDALRDAIDLEHAQSIAQAVTDLYADTLSEADRIRLDALRARLAASEDLSPTPGVLGPTD